MIDWVHEKLRAWGEAKRKINNTRTPPKSLLGKLSSGWSIKTADSFGARNPPEVMLRDALITARAIRLARESGKLSPRHYEALYAFYVLTGSSMYKAAMVGVSVSYLYRLRNSAHVGICGLLNQCEIEHKETEKKQELMYGS